MKTVTVDTLHCFYLGIIRNLIWIFVWHFIDNRVWIKQGTIEERVQNCCVMFKVKLHAFYICHQQSNPDKQLTRVDDITPGMIDKDQKYMSTKGAESWGVLMFWIAELQKHPGVPDQTRLLTAARQLEIMVDVWDNAAWKLTDTEIRTCRDAWVAFCRLTKHLSSRVEFPKRHLGIHLISQLKWFGNPRFYAVWKDESLNKVLKATCRQVHQHTFDSQIIGSLNALLREKRIN